MVSGFSDETGQGPGSCGLFLEATASWNVKEMVLELVSTDHSSADKRPPSDSGNWEIFLASPPSLLDRWQIVVITGSSDSSGALSTKSIRAFPPDGGSEFQVARLPEKPGSCRQRIEVKIPWKSLDAHGKTGQRLRVQLQFYRVDAAGKRQTWRWFPSAESWIDPTHAFEIELGQKASPRCDLCASVTQENLRRIHLDVTAPPECAGPTATIFRNNRPLATGSLALRDGAAVTRITLPFPNYDEIDQPLVVRAGRGSLGVVPLHAVKAVVQDKLQRAMLRYLPFVFQGEKLPVADLEQPTEFDTLAGPYRIETTYYDSGRRPVVTAANPGRYGAVSRIITASGRVFVRYHTLFRQPNDTPFWAWKIGGKIDIRESLGISGTAMDQESVVADEIVRERMIDAFHRDQEWPVLLAALSERDPAAGKAAYWDDAFARDRAWWLPLKLDLYKMAPRPFEGPQPLSGKPAPVLREGTPAEAGVDAGAITRINAALEDWSRESEEAFTVCLARNGIVFFHQAYGTRNGQPATTDDICFMASITKMMGASAVMMLVEEGRLDLDADIARYLPPLQPINAPRPVTLRHCLTHTAGMAEHSGDKLSDFPERIADFYAALPVGRRFQYNGDSYELAGKIVELSSGEIIPRFQKKHLLDPLGMTHTQVRNMSGGTMSTAADMARFGQMFLNRGAYGPYRFLRESTVESMRPQKLAGVLGASTDRVWGLGMMPFDDEPLGQGVMGHGAASGAILRIDPKRGLVISMVRNAPGKNYDSRKTGFLKAIADSIPAGGAH